jgi:GxxExxY protein
MEKVYEEVLCYRLTKRGLNVKHQQKIEFVYEEVRMDIELRYDLMVEESVIVDIKSRETVPPVDYKIFKTCLRLTNITAGLVINFNVEYLKEGIKRVANNFSEK